MSGNIDQLIVRLDETVVQTFSLDVPVVTIGRSADNMIALPHPKVSRRHAEIRMGANATVIVDLGSANGILIDGERMREQQVRLLRPGSVVRIGPYTLTYHLQTNAEAALPRLPEAETIQDVYAAHQAAFREEHLHGEVADLHIQIDPNRRQQQVNEITESEYFRHLREAATRVRSTRPRPPGEPQ
jgi:predicted component of type VI protein secretion system